MQAGLIFSADIYEQNAWFTGASVSVGTENFGSYLLSRTQSTYTPNADDVDLGIMISVHSQRGGDGPINTTESVYKLNIPHSSVNIDETVTIPATFMSAMYARVELANLKLYALSDRWRLKFDSIKWYDALTGGSLLHAAWTAGWSIDGPSGLLIPSAIPLIGIPAELAPVAGVDVDLPA